MVMNKVINSNYILKIYGIERTEDNQIVIVVYFLLMLLVYIICLVWLHYYLMVYTIHILIRIHLISLLNPFDFLFFEW